jgi:hypothetical protein
MPMCLDGRVRNACPKSWYALKARTDDSSFVTGIEIFVDGAEAKFDRRKRRVAPAGKNRWIQPRQPVIP